MLQTTFLFLSTRRERGLKAERVAFDIADDLRK